MRIIVHHVFVNGAGAVGLITFLRNWQFKLLPVVKKIIATQFSAETYLACLATRGRVNKKKQAVALSVSDDRIANLVVSRYKAVHL